MTLSLAAPVGFSNFARAALAPSARTVQVPAPGADLWPCPSPTEWRWTGPRPSPRKRKLIAKRVLSSRLLQLIVCALNWQPLGHPLQPPPAARLGALLSELQGAMLERLERFVMYFLSAPPVDLEALGRSADKFRDLFDRAGRLPLRCGAPVEPLLRDLVQDLNPYSRLRGPAESPTVRDEEPEAANALVASWAPAGAVQVASHGDQSPRSSCKPVRASRIKWPYSPSFDPRPFLHEPLTRAAFEDPEVLRISPGPARSERPALVHATRQELLLLARTWDEAGCLAIFPAAAVRRDEAVGLLTVAKDQDYDRLIVNPTVLNSRTATISRQTRTLAPGSMFSLIALAPDEALRLSSDDLREFYHTFIVSRARAKRNCIGLAFSDSEPRALRVQGL